MALIQHFYQIKKETTMAKQNHELWIQHTHMNQNYKFIELVKDWIEKTKLLRWHSTPSLHLSFQSNSKRCCRIVDLPSLTCLLTKPVASVNKLDRALVPCVLK